MKFKLRPRHLWIFVLAAMATFCQSLYNFWIYDFVYLPYDIGFFIGASISFFITVSVFSYYIREQLKEEREISHSSQKEATK